MNKVKVQGLKQLQDTLENLASAAQGKDVAGVLLEGAYEIQEGIKHQLWRQLLVDGGDLLDSIIVEVIKPNHVEVQSGLPYTLVHEFGLPKGGVGMWPATPRQIAFFWYKYSETGKSMWRAMALKGGYTIPPRPYFRPGADEAQPRAVEAIANATRDLIEDSV